MAALPAVALPPQPQNNAIRLPPQPANPPTANDVLKAVRYCRYLEFIAGNGPATADDVAAAHIYSSNVLQAYAGDAMIPPWANELNHSVNELRRTCAQLRNAEGGDGRRIAYEVIPFADGTSPVAHPHNLPRLSNIDDIDNLDGVTATAYYQGYYPGIAVPDLIEERRIAVSRAIVVSRT